MSPTVISVILFIVILIVIGLVLLYRFGTKEQVKQVEAMNVLESYAQVVNILVIDKKKMRYKDAPLPKEFFEQAPRRSKFFSAYVVKAKIGPKIFNLLCDKSVFELIPEKGSIKAKVSGLYIMEVISGAQPSEKMIEKRKKEKAKAEKKAAKKAANQEKLSAKAMEDAKKNSKKI